MTPAIQVHAVYEVPCDSEEALLEIDDFYHSLDLFEQSAAYRKRIIPLVLIDATIANTDSRLDFGNFTQEMELAPREHWQVAYDEAVLANDGKTLIERGPGCADGLEAGRICFYFHFYDPVRPLRWTYGEFTCPAPAAIPDLLTELVPYQEI